MFIRIRNTIWNNDDARINFTWTPTHWLTRTSVVSRRSKATNLRIQVVLTMGCNGSKQVEYVEITSRCASPGVTFSEEITVINGGNRNVVSWLPEAQPIKAIVLISHGLNEHALRYYGIGIELANHGFGVYAIDHVSHGKSDGKRGIIENHATMYEDFIAFGKFVKEQYPTLPLYLLAHSMGTLVGIMSINGIKDIKAVVLSGPAIFSGPGSSSPFGCRCLYPLSQTSFAVCLTSVTSVLDPGGPAAPLVIGELTSDPAELEINSKDPRVAPPVVTNKSAYEVVKLIAAAKQEIPNIKVPFLCIHGADDLIALPKSTDYVCEHIGTPAALQQKHIIANAKHEPFHEIESIRTAAFALVVQYFETQYLNKDLVVEDSSVVITDTVASTVGATVEATAAAAGGESTSTAEDVLDAADINIGVELTSK